MRPLEIFNPRIRKTYVVFVFLILTGLSSYAQTEDYKNELVTKWDSFISYWHEQDAEGCASFFLEDALHIAPEFPINDSREAIAEFYNFLFSNHSSSQYQHNIISIETLGEDILENGEFMVDWVRNDGSEWLFHARSLTHWVKNQGGDWKIKTLMFNSAPQQP
ncbi:YybH family protein [Pararhodonellum marinum]|uniref:YybH family protein n=1 Tax=Pararhodonellum marinum TaxID=2755358 RepID=UPI00189059F7|nr:nuclear transport factor 2 family protein [Pararhodonellum marinum]